MKKTLSFILIPVILLTFCACGKSAALSEKSGEYSPVPAPAMAYSDSTAAYAYDIAEEEICEAPAEAYGGFAADNSASEVSVQQSGSSDINPEKIIYSANSQLETTEFDETLGKLSELIESYKGFVESSSINSSNYYSQSHGYPANRSASYTIRVPSSSFSALMSELSRLGNVPYTNTYTENITSQYYDVQARLEAYKTQETRLLEMMEIAESVEDIITIEDRLTEIRYEIESMQSDLNNWDRRVSYSTLYLDVTEVEKYTPVDSVKTPYSEKLVQAVKSGIRSVGEFFSDFLLWLLEALPTLIILGLLTWGVVAFIKKRSLSREQRKARRLAKKQSGNVESLPESPADENPASK